MIAFSDETTRIFNAEALYLSCATQVHNTKEKHIVFVHVIFQKCVF